MSLDANPRSLVWHHINITLHCGPQDDDYDVELSIWHPGLSPSRVAVAKPRGNGRVLTPIYDQTLLEIAHNRWLFFILIWGGCTLYVYCDLLLLARKKTMFGSPLFLASDAIEFGTIILWGSIVALGLSEPLSIQSGISVPVRLKTKSIRLDMWFEFIIYHEHVFAIRRR